jgi:hypothetical protein
VERPGALGQSLRDLVSDLQRGVEKPTLSDLRAHARGLGGKCLAEQYAKSSEGLPWRCKEGHTWTAPWSRIRGGAWCPGCARDRRRLPKPRLTLEVMHTYAAKFGGKCLSDRYVNSNTKLTWQCAKGHVFEAVQYSVAAGSWCPDCAGARKGSLADLVAVARERGGECLSREYLGVSASYRWRCAEGHEWNAPSPGTSSMAPGARCARAGSRSGSMCSMRSPVNTVVSVCRRST